MKDIIIRPLKPQDMDQMLDLLATRSDLAEGGAEKRKRLMEWIAFHNPAADNEPTYFIAEDHGTVVAHFGRMPIEIFYNGALSRAYFAHDLYVHPEYRKKGAGLFLSMALYKALEDNSKSPFFCIWTNEINLGFQRRRGYPEVRYANFRKILNPRYRFDKLLGNTRLSEYLSRIVAKMLLIADLPLMAGNPFTSKKNRIEICGLDRFDPNFDSWLQSLYPKYGIITSRNAVYLNWKHFDRPFSRMEAFAACVDGKMKGFIVLTVNPLGAYQEGTIADIVADPADKKTISALYRAAIRRFRRQGAHEIKCCMTSRDFSALLRKFLFVRLPSVYPLTIANLEKGQNRDYLLGIDNWHLCSGDSDAFMLDP